MVQLYSKTIGLYNKPNTLICHAEDFYPPEISIELLKNNEVISEAKHSEMAFTDKWLYRVTRFTDFTPKSGDKYSCRVTHQGRERTYKWGEGLSLVLFSHKYIFSVGITVHRFLRLCIVVYHCVLLCITVSEVCAAQIISREPLD